MADVIVANKADQPIPVDLAIGDEVTIILPSDITSSIDGEKVLKTGIWNVVPITASDTLPVQDDEYTQLLDWPDANTTYIGWATPGSASSAASWKIQKITFTAGNPTAIEWADGNLNFDNIWDNRASLSYS